MTLSTRALGFSIAVLLASAPAAVHAQAPRAYHVEDLGTWGGKDVVGMAINIHGEIAGWAHLPDGTIQAFRWTRSGGLENLGTPAGATYSDGRGINDHGDVVGAATFEFDYALGVIAPRGGIMRHLWSPERQMRTINVITNGGQLLGQAGESFTAFRTRTDGTFHEIGWPSRYSVATDINDAGDVVGWDWFGGGMAWKYSDTFTSCRLAPCGKIMLGYLSGVFASQALSLNNSGVAVGWAALSDGRPRAWRAHAGMPLEDLGAFGGGGSTAEAINNAGTIVGWSGDYWPITAFVYTDTDGMLDLNTRVPASEHAPLLHRAVAINEVGQIVAWYRTEHGSGTVLLTPVIDTEPPVITTASASTSVLQPPDGRMIPLTLTVSASDNMDPAPVCAITSVVSNEAPSGSDADIEFTGAFSLSLRASRLGTGDGRTYTITVRCNDDSGNASMADVLVLVPHDNR